MSAVCNQLHPINKNMFPANPSTDTHFIRNREILKVNKTHSEYYKKSTIPYLQRRLNTHFQKLGELKRRRGVAARARGKSGKSELV